jgi:hypothetical protein
MNLTVEERGPDVRFHVPPGAESDGRRAQAPAPPGRWCLDTRTADWNALTNVNFPIDAPGGSITELNRMAVVDALLELEQCLRVARLRIVSPGEDAMPDAFETLGPLAALVHARLT